MKKLRKMAGNLPSQTILYCVTEIEKAPEKKRRRWPAWVALGAFVLLAILGGAAWLTQDKLMGQLTAIPNAMPTNSDRPEIAPETDPKARTILLLGSDKRADGSVAGERSDTMMVARVAADRKSVSVISIPRDSWVEVPGHGDAKINAAFAFGGPALAVQTVENLSGVRIDHVAVIDWEGFKQLTDALGGVTVKIPKTVYDPYRKKTWEAGTHLLDGEDTLTYVRQRAGLPGGDLDRVKRQQNVIRELVSETLTRGTLANPVTVYQVLDSVTSNLEVDDGWSASDMRSLAYSLRSLRKDDIYFATIPVRGTGMVGSQSVVHLDPVEAQSMWKAFKKDDVAAWITAQKRGLDKRVL